MAPHNAICIQFNCDWKRVGQMISSVQNQSNLEQININYDGSRICVGDLGGKGTTRVFDLNGNTWTKVGQDINGSNYEDQCGYCGLSPDGQRLIIGSLRASNNGFDRNGRVEVFEFDGTGWKPLGQTFYGDGNSFEIGHTPKIVGDNNSIMAYQSRTSNKSGKIRVFRLVENQWQNIGDLYGGPDDEMGDYHAFDISHDGKRVIAGSHRGTECAGENGENDYMGYVKVFEYKSGNDWGQIGGTLCYPVPGGGQRFGSSVTISGDGRRIAAAAKLWDNGVGYAVAYDIDDDGDGIYSFRQLGQILYGLVVYGGNRPRFGYNMRMSYDGSRLLVTAPFEHDEERKGANGTIRIYDLKNNQWEVMGSPIAGTDMTYNDDRSRELGKFVALAGNGERIVFTDSKFNYGSGRGYIYEYGKV